MGLSKSMTMPIAHKRSCPMTILYLVSVLHGASSTKKSHVTATFTLCKPRSEWSSLWWRALSQNHPLIILWLDPPSSKMYNGLLTNFWLLLLATNWTIVVVVGSESFCYYQVILLLHQYLLCCPYPCLGVKSYLNHNRFFSFWTHSS